MPDKNAISDAEGWIDALIGAQRPRHSLDQAFYTHPAVFERDRARILGNHWILAGHASDIPEPGDYRLFEVAGESIILVRDARGAVRAHYNVCRHRGSRVLLAPAGRARAMTCRTTDGPTGPTAACSPRRACLMISARKSMA